MPMNQSLPRSTPEAEGVESVAITELVDALEDGGFGPHSLMVLRHGQVVAEGCWTPYERSRPHIMFSVSKSFTATAIGIAQDEGRLSVDEPILNFFPSYATPSVRANMEGVKLRHLLSMATGHATDTMVIMRAQPDEDWVKVFFEVPIEYPPGTHFLYNSGASFVLSAVVASRTGQHVVDYLRPRLFEPLGIATPPWETNARGINLGASGLRLLTEDVAKFGQLYLQRGRWDGRQLLSEAWIDEASRSHVANGPATPDWSQGYGFQLWRSRHDSYRADGAYGQFSLILPNQDLVVAITSGSENSREVVPAVWDTLLPAIHDAPLSANPVAAGALADRLAHLEVPVPDYLPSDPPLAAAIAGRRISVGFNRLGVVALEVTADDKTITLQTYDGDDYSETVVAGRDDWLPGSTRRWPYEEMETANVAARGGWIDEWTLQFDWQCVDTPFRRVWELHLDDASHATLTVGLDLGFWEDDTVTLPASIG
jgi:CubicO group peptidase (beta-lactamase class C family)